MKKLRLLFSFSMFGILINIHLGQDTLNCFQIHSEAKYTETPLYQYYSRPTSPVSVTISVDFSDTINKVSKYVYGTNANIYCGNMNYNTDLVEYLANLSPNIIRYPGGLHSNEYFWNATPSTFPSDLPAMLTNSSGGEYEPYWVPGSGSWTFSLDDFYSFCENTNAEPLITVNYAFARYGTGPNPVERAAKLAADWVRYDNGRTRFWEIGNENYRTWSSGYRIDTSLNQDDQPMFLTPALYGEQFKIFADSMRNAAAEIGHTIYIGAQNDPGVLETAGNSPDWMVDHTYFTNYGENSNIPTILNSVNSEMEKYANLVEEQTTLWGTDSKPITLTEWNIFAEGSGQQSSYINGMHAVLVLGEAIRNNYGMTNRWDIQNGWTLGDDFGMFSRGIPAPDPIANPRAPYYYMYYFQEYFGDHMIKSHVSGSNSMVSYASRFESGEIGLIIVNKGTSTETLTIRTDNILYGNRFYYHSLTGGTDNEPFSYKVYVNGYGPSGYRKIGGPIEKLDTIRAYSDSIDKPIKLLSPKYSVQFILIETGDHEIDTIDATGIQISNLNNNDFIYRNLTPTFPIMANVLPDNAFNNTVLWSTSDDNVASIDEYGELSLKADGDIYIKASLQENPLISDSVFVRSRVQATELIVGVTTGDSNLIAGNTIRLFAHIDPMDASNKDVIWSVSDTVIATIDELGYVTGKSAGTITISATTTDGSNLTSTIDLLVTGSLNSSEYYSGQFRIYPNPAQNLININTEWLFKQIEIKDLNGRVAYFNKVSDTNEMEITISLAKGIYLVVISSDKMLMTKKLIIQ